jgi:MFS superfamily sulfate permease-like transporter
MYAAFMGPFVYVLLGTVPAMTIGPTTLMALIIQKYANIHPGYAPFLALCNGVIILTCGILRLGKDFYYINKYKKI